MSHHDLAPRLKLLFPLLFLALCACERTTPTLETMNAADSPSPHAKFAWSATLGESRGDGVIKIKPRDSDGFMSLTQGQTLSPGDTISTGSAAFATLSISPGSGQVQLGELSEVSLRKDGPGLVVHHGHARVDSPQRAQGAPAPSIILPSGEVELVGTSVSIDATPEQSKVSVAHGEVLAIGDQGQELRAHFGEEIVLREGHAPRLTQAPDLGHAFSWSEALKPKIKDVDLPELERGMGKLVARRPYSEQEQPLDLKRHEIKVRVQGMMAYTEITEEFYNPSGEQLEGLYRFPLPPNAQISKLSLLVGNKWMEGQFVENARAERIWRALTKPPNRTPEKRIPPRDPALLQWKQGNQFELKIFPIPPRGSRKITIGYVQRLDATGDGYRYTYPMPVDRTGQSKAGTFVFDATVQGLAKDAPLQLERYEGAKVVRDDRAGEGLASVHFEQQDFQPAGDLSMRFTLPQTRHELRTYLYDPPKSKRKDEDGAYVALSLRPQFESGYEETGKDFVLVLDTSYGRQGPAMHIQRALAQRLIDEMSAKDRVRVLSCNHRCASVGSKEFLPAKAETIVTLQDDLDRLEAKGSTYALEAMRSATRVLEARDDQGREGHILYMTDGVVSAGAAHPSSLERGVAGLTEASTPKVSLISFGGDEDRANLQAIADGANGRVLALTPGDSMTASALDILRHHYSAALDKIAIQWPAGVERVYPEKIPALLPGEELVVVARVKEDIKAGELLVRGVQQGALKEFSYPVSFVRAQSSEGNAFVPRLWAKHRIEAMERLDGEMHEGIVELSKDFGILTRYTSLLALESDEMMREFNVSHQRHTDWLGDEAPEAKSESFSDGTPGGLSKGKRSRSRSPQPQSTKMSKKSSKPKKRARRRRPIRQCGDELVSSQTIYTAPSSFIKRRAKRALETLSADPENRTATMDAIRRSMKLGEEGEGDVRRLIAQWLEINDMDPEAIVLRGQVALNKGEMEEAADWLFSAPDAAARAEWLLERVKLASQAMGDEGMTCAYDWTLMDSKKRRASDRDPLECGATTPSRDLFAHAPGQDELSNERFELMSNVTSLPNKRSKRRGEDIEIDLTWEVNEGAPDRELHVVLVEPTGRLLSWMSQRQGLIVTRERGRQRLVLPRRRPGQYEVRVLAADGSPALEPFKLKVKQVSSTRTHSFDSASHNTSLLALTLGTKRVCRDVEQDPFKPSRREESSNWRYDVLIGE